MDTIRNVYYIRGHQVDKINFCHFTFSLNNAISTVLRNGSILQHLEHNNVDKPRRCTSECLQFNVITQTIDDLVYLSKYIALTVMLYNVVIMDWAINTTGLIITSGTCCGQEANLWTTYPVADLALEVAGGWWTKFAQIPFGLQLLNALYFELFYSWLACGTPTISVHRECFQFRGCDAALSHCGL